jgi:predicted nucleotidyltransferase
MQLRVTALYLIRLFHLAPHHRNLQIQARISRPRGRRSHSAASTNATLAESSSGTAARTKTAIIGRMGLEGLRRHRREILDSAARHGVRHVRVFGSVARGDDHENSDVDFLVDVEPGRTLLDVIAFEQDVQQLLGRHVDVLTDGGLSPYLQHRILAEATSL